MPTSLTPSYMQWHSWFAWRPVIIHGIYDRAGAWPVAWLEDVERRWTLGATDGLGPRWVYRRRHQRQIKQSLFDDY